MKVRNLTSVVISLFLLTLAGCASTGTTDSGVSDELLNSPIPTSQKFVGYGPFSVEVNYDLSLREATSRAGFSLWENFYNFDYPVPNRSGTQSRDIYLVKAGSDDSAEEVLNDLRAKNLRPADIYELLALASSRPDLQIRFPVTTIYPEEGWGEGSFMGENFPFLIRYEDNSRWLVMEPWTGLQTHYDPGHYPEKTSIHIAAVYLPENN